MNKYHLKLIKYITISITILIAIWGLGPYLAIAGKTPFASLISKIIPTITLLLCWATIGIRILLRQRKKILTNPLFQQSKQILATFTKKTPCFLLLGNENAGKKNLLVNTGLNLQHMPTQYLDWYMGNNSVFIVPSKNLHLSDQDGDNIWQSFVELLTQQRRPVTLRGIIITIDLPTFIQTDKALTLTQQLAKQIETITLCKQSIPLTLVITKSDYLHGFSEFFYDLNPSEQQQCFGLEFANNSVSTVPISELFKERFHTLVKQINERLTWLLQHEKNLTRRLLINDFPLQLESLGNILEEIINQLPINSNTPLSGIYLTSNIQTGNTINLLRHSSINNFHLITSEYPKQINLQTGSQKPYFIKNLFKKILENDNQKSTQLTKKYYYRLASYPTALVIILFGVIIWHHAFRHNALALNHAKSTLNQHITSPVWLSHLNMLQKTLTDLKQNTAIHFRWIGLGQSEKLYNQTSKTYQKLIRSNFVLYLDQLLTKAIQKDMDHHQNGLYDSLQVYLMFAKPAHREANVVKRWFRQFWEIQYPKNKIVQQQLMQHLNYLLTLNHIAWPMNYTMVYKAQAILKKRPLVQLAFSKLQHEYNKSQVPLFKEQADTDIDMSTATISAVYSTQNFNVIYQNKIPHIVSSIIKNNWVIEDNDTKPFNENQSQQLIQALRTRYSKEYVKHWKQSLHQVKLQTPKNLAQVIKQINFLSDGQSLLWQSLKKIAQRHKISDTDLNSLDNLSQQNDQYKTMVKALTNLKQYLNQITTSPDSTKTAYVMSAKRMRHGGIHDPISNLIQFSQQLPPPFNHWLKTLTTSSWKIMLNQARQHLNAIWTAGILPEYHNNIANRFPIFKTATQTISLKSFNRFFGPEGTMESFFNYYLEPFVNTSHVYWNWKSLNGEHINIPQKKLEMFIRASMIQKMFYTNNPDSPNIKFSLTPIQLSPNIKHFTLNVSGQTIHYRPGIKKTKQLVWSNTSNNFVTVQFDALKGVKQTKTKTGLWAWLRWVYQSHIKMLSDPQTFQITFKLRGNEARYQLKADNPVNPYLPHVLAAFRCPTNL